MNRTRLIALGLLLLALAAGAATLAAFSATTTNSGNSFSAGAALSGMRINTGTYTGNGGDNRTITVGFQPDVVLVKAATAQTGVMRTASFAGDLTKDMTGATTVAGNMIQAFGTTTFQVGTDNRVN